MLSDVQPAPACAPAMARTCARVASMIGSLALSIGLLIEPRIIAINSSATVGWANDSGNLRRSSSLFRKIKILMPLVASF